jgi:hypothetical protein
MAERLLTTALDPFGHCFLVLQWNLMSRANNVAQVAFPHLRWHEDALQVCTCRRPKPTSLASAPRTRITCNANPFAPAICPVLALGVYLLSPTGRPRTTACFRVAARRHVSPARSRHCCATRTRPTCVGRMVSRRAIWDRTPFGRVYSRTSAEARATADRASYRWRFAPAGSWTTCRSAICATRTPATSSWGESPQACRLVRALFRSGRSPLCRGDARAAVGGGRLLPVRGAHSRHARGQHVLPGLARLPLRVAGRKAALGAHLPSVPAGQGRSLAADAAREPSEPGPAVACLSHRHSATCSAGVRRFA